MGKRPKARRVGPAGLSVVRGPRADGRHYWRARVRGTVCWTGWATVEEAEKATIETLADGSWNLEESVDAVVHTVEDVLDFWIGHQEQRADLGEGTLKTYRQRAACLRRVLGEYPARQLGFRLGELYRDTELRRGKAGSTIFAELRTLRQAAAWATAMELGEVGTLPKVRLPKDTRLRHTPTHEDVQKVLQVLNGADRLVIWLLYRTGARPVGLRRLTWGDVDTRRGTISIRSTKSNPRHVPIVDAELLEALEAVRGNAGDLVLWPNTNEWNTRRVLVRACRAAEVRHFTPYALRRLAVDTLYRVTDPGTAAAILGHSATVALKHYRRASDLETRSAMARALGESSGKVHQFPQRKTRGD